MRIPRVSVALLGLLTLVLSIGIVGCEDPDPFEVGRTLGETHVALIRADQLDLERLNADLERAEARFDRRKDRDRFKEGYREAVRPVRAELAAMAMEAAGEAAGEAIADVMEGMGEGFGRALNGFMRGLQKDDGQNRPSKEASGEGTAKPNHDEAMKDLGRDLGKMMKGLADSAEKVAEGMDEELAKP